MATKKKVEKPAVEEKTRKAPVRKPLPEGMKHITETGEINGLHTSVSYYRWTHEGQEYKVVSKTKAMALYDRLLRPPRWGDPKARLQTKITNFQDSIRMFEQYPELQSYMTALNAVCDNTLENMGVIPETEEAKAPEASQESSW